VAPVRCDHRDQGGADAQGQSPDLVKLNVAFEGSGTIWIRDVELVKTPLA